MPRGKGQPRQRDKLGRFVTRMASPTQSTTDDEPEGNVHDGNVDLNDVVELDGNENSQGEELCLNWCDFFR